MVDFILAKGKKDLFCLKLLHDGVDTIQITKLTVYLPYIYSF